MTQGAALAAPLPIGAGALMDPSDSKRSSPPVALPTGSGSPALVVDEARVKRVLDRSEKVAAKAAKEEKDGTIGCVEALFTLLECYGCESRLSPSVEGTRVKKSFNKTVEHWYMGARACGEFGWMKFAKYKFAAFFHSKTPQLDDPVPLPFPLTFNDRPHLLCHGICSKYIDKVLRSPSRDSFVTSVSQLKKGCPRPTKAMVEKQVQKSVEALTTVHVQPPDVELFTQWADQDDFEALGIRTLINRQNMIAELHRTVDELFAGLTYTDDHRAAPKMPTTKSTFERTCAEGGGIDSLQQLAAEMGLNRIVNAGERTEGKSGVRFTEAKIDEEDEHLRGLFGLIGGNDGVIADITDTEHKYTLLYERAFRLAVNETPKVKAVGLAESLKIRVITKGPAMTGFALKPLQKFLWSAVKRHPAFTLIGEPVNKWTVQNRLGANLLPGEAYLSGDYSAATDNLAPWVSETLANRIAMRIGLTEDERVLFVKALTQHVFVDEKGVERPQRWGQLMGSVASFPVLCIANAAMCRWSLELAYSRKMRLSDTSLLINGDDCLFRTTRAGLRFWKIITTFGGLTPSLGKFYYSRAFAQVNSANFNRLDVPVRELYSEDTYRDSWFSEVKYVNLGLLLGLKRSGEKVGKDAVTKERDSLGSRCRELIDSAPSYMAYGLLRKFISHHDAILKSIRVPWFAPESWGGVGLPTIRSPDEMVLSDLDDPNSFVVTHPKCGMDKLHLRAAARILERQADFKVQKAPGVGTWEMHKIAISRVPAGWEFGEPTEEQERNWQRLYGTLVVDCLFSGGKLHGDKESATKRAMMVLRANERSWGKAIRSQRLPPPLSAHTLTEVTLGVDFVNCELLSGNALPFMADAGIIPFGFDDFHPEDLW